jgi:hypothetical protein
MTDARRIFGKAPTMRLPGGGGSIKTARCLMMGAAQTLLNGSTQAVLWNASGLIPSGGNGWDDLGCTIVEGGYGIKCPPGIYLMHVNITLAAVARSGTYMAYGMNVDENDVPFVGGPVVSGQYVYISWDDISDVGSYDELFVNVWQSTGGSMQITAAVISLARLCDGHGGGGG